MALLRPCGGSPPVSGVGDPASEPCPVAIESGGGVPDGALLGAPGRPGWQQYAVWGLGPDLAVDRQQRALRVVDEIYKRALQYHDELRPYVDESHPDAFPWLDSGEHMRRRRAEARARWIGAGGLRVGQSLEMTAVVPVVASSVFAPREALDVRLLWRQLSGDAHALTWQLVGRSRLGERVGGGMAEFAAGGTSSSRETSLARSFASPSETGPCSIVAARSSGASSRWLR